MTDEAAVASSRRGVLVTVATAAVVLVVFAGVGAAGGWLWHHLWDAPSGSAYQGKWYPDDETSLGREFDATGLYVSIGFVGGLLLGVLTGLLSRRRELVVLAAVLVGSVLAAWLSFRIGTHLGPPDPAAVAAHAADGAHIPDRMRMPGHGPYIAWSLGALLGLGVIYLTTSAASRAKTEVARREADDPQWLSRNPTG